MPISAKSRGAGKKATDAQRELRVNMIFEWLLAGYTRSQIIQNVSNPKDPTKAWDIDVRQIDNYIKAATLLIKQSSESYRKNAFEMSVARLNGLYQAAMRVQDYGQALQTQKEINKLLALYEAPAPQVISNEYSGTVNVELSAEERFERVMGILDTARARRTGRAPHNDA